MEEEDESGTCNGAALRTLLAVRSVLFTETGGVEPPWDDLRIVVPLTRPDRAIRSAGFSVPIDDKGDVSRNESQVLGKATSQKSIDVAGRRRDIVCVQDLSLFV